MPDLTDIETRIKRQYPEVDLSYQWIWPPTNQKILYFYGEPIDNLKEEDFTVRLFHKFHDALISAAGDRDQVLKIIELIVREWGGIRNNKPATLAAYADHLITGNLKKLFVTSGISSKSKILAAWDPEQYFIYDSRVAIALQKLYSEKYKFHIPNPKIGENRKIQIKRLIGELKQSRGERVDYLGFCEGLRNTGHGSQLEKKLFILGKYIQEQADPRKFSGY